MTLVLCTRKRRRRLMSLQTTRATIWHSKVVTDNRTRVRTCLRPSTCKRRRILTARLSS